MLILKTPLDFEPLGVSHDGTKKQKGAHAGFIACLEGRRYCPEFLLLFLFCAPL